MTTSTISAAPQIPPPAASRLPAHFTRHGFLPPHDPARSFIHYTQLALLDDLGRDLPSLLHDPGFRKYAAALDIPPWPTAHPTPDDLPELRLYYVRLGFLASAYINQVGQERASLLPKNIAVPLANVCRLLRRPPILSYDGYALYNWKRFDPRGPIALGNIDTIQNFVHLYDEHWFILVHVEIESIAAEILSSIDRAASALTANTHDPTIVNDSLRSLASAVWRQVAVLRRIPEKMDPALYYRTFRPYISFFENVLYEGVSSTPVNYRGETGAQSSILPVLVACMKIHHEESALTRHLADMRSYMPAEHRDLLTQIAALPDPRPLADKDPYNDVLASIATFREVHFGWAQEYIAKRIPDPRGTGGTPYMRWLHQLISETRSARIA